MRIDGSAYPRLGHLPADAPAMTERAARCCRRARSTSFEAGGVALTLDVPLAALPDDLDLVLAPGDLPDLGGARDRRPRPRRLALLRRLGGVGGQHAGAEGHVGALDRRRRSTCCASARSSSRCSRSPATTCASTGATCTSRARAGARHRSGRSAPTSRCAPASRATGALPAGDDPRMPRAARRRSGRCSRVAFDLGRSSRRRSARHVILAYDDDARSSTSSSGLRALLAARTAWTPRRCSHEAEADYAKSASRRCEAFDDELMGDLTRAGGEEYARLAALAYPPVARRAQARRRAEDGAPLSSRKENFSNGCIATVDVIYPAAPALPAVQPGAAQGAARAAARLRAIGALEVRLRPARPRHLPAGQRPGLRRRRADARRTRCRSRSAATCC